MTLKATSLFGNAVFSLDVRCCCVADVRRNRDKGTEQPCKPGQNIRCWLNSLSTVYILIGMRRRLSLHRERMQGSACELREAHEGQRVREQMEVREKVKRVK